VIFEYDPNKSAINKTKHGIDFETAKDLWLDPNALIVPAKNSGESRFARIAKLKGKIWCAVFVERQNKVRLISARRAHNKEEREYENFDG
jgi:uncharacterized DUF497 family protein